MPPITTQEFQTAVQVLRTDEFWWSLYGFAREAERLFSGTSNPYGQLVTSHYTDAITQGCTNWETYKTHWSQLANDLNIARNYIFRNIQLLDPRAGGVSGVMLALGRLVSTDVGILIVAGGSGGIALVSGGVLLSGVVGVLTGLLINEGLDSLSQYLLGDDYAGVLYENFDYVREFVDWTVSD